MCDRLCDFRLHVSLMCDFRGPVVTDILERDRNCIWTCGTVTSFYINTRERTSMCEFLLTFYLDLSIPLILDRFRQRLLQAMGYNVASVAFWQMARLKYAS